MQEILQLAWKRFGVITGIIGDLQGRVLLTALYFTILVPFGVGTRVLSDPLHRRDRARWLQRPAIPSDLEASKRQG